MTYRVLAIRADAGGCARYRVVEPARAVNEANLGVEVTVKSHLNVDARRDRISKFVSVDAVNENVDLISFQRPLNSDLFYCMKQAQRQGIATVVELDDDFENVHQRNVAWQWVHPKFQPTSNWEWLHKAANIADLVTCSTPALQRYGSHGRTALVRNYIPRADIAPAYSRTPTDGPVRIGWSGTLQTHPDDLDQTRGGVTRGVEEVGGRISIVGDMAGVRKALRAPETVEMTQTGWVPLEDYMQTLADNVDIGIVPLANSPFNQAKSALKGIEMSAKGIPFIASDLSEYRILNAYGAGQIARAPGDWRRWISRWARNDSWIEVGERYRQVVASDYVLEDHAGEWAAAWVRAIEISKASGKIPSWRQSALS